MGDLQVQNATVITQPKADVKGPAVITARIFNNGIRSQTLDAISLPGTSARVKISAAKGAGPVTDDETFVLDLLRAKKILVTHGTGFNWFEPDHFRLVTLPDVEVLTEAIGRIADFLETVRD